MKGRILRNESAKEFMKRKKEGICKMNDPLSIPGQIKFIFLFLSVPDWLVW